MADRSAATWWYEVVCMSARMTRGLISVTNLQPYQHLGLLQGPKRGHGVCTLNVFRRRCHLDHFDQDRARLRFHPMLRSGHPSHYRYRPVQRLDSAKV